MGATLEQSYRHLTRLHRHDDPAGAAATARLPAVTRHHVHALGGFAAHARLVASSPGTDAGATLAALADALVTGVAAGSSDDLVLRAVVHTHRAYGLDVSVWTRHLADLAHDPPLRERLDAARRLATLVVPVLEPVDARAGDHVGDLAVSAALTRALALDAAAATGAHPLAQTIARARRLLISADLGMRWLPPASARAVRAHRTLLAATLDRVQEAGLDHGPVSTTPPWGAWVVARWGGWARPGGRLSEAGPPT